MLLPLEGQQEASRLEVFRGAVQRVEGGYRDGNREAYFESSHPGPHSTSALQDRGNNLPHC